MPCTAKAISSFRSHKVLFGPAKAANAGGVFTKLSFSVTVWSSPSVGCGKWA
jgi:glutamate dehydrogenase/leucine dehydrogenase